MEDMTLEEARRILEREQLKEKTGVLQADQEKVRLCEALIDILTKLASTLEEE
jgi:hypothetical protein